MTLASSCGRFGTRRRARWSTPSCREASTTSTGSRRSGARRSPTGSRRSAPGFGRPVRLDRREDLDDGGAEDAAHLERVRLLAPVVRLEAGDAGLRGGEEVVLLGPTLVEPAPE